MTPLLQLALRLAAQPTPTGEGWKVFFISVGKTPMKGSHGHLEATNDPAALTELYWKYRVPRFIGYAMGANGVAVLDFDFDKHPEAAPWWEANKARLPRTFTYRTRSGGLHYVFRAHPMARIAHGHIESGVDVKAGSSWCGAWFMHGCEVVDTAPVAPWPEWLEIPREKASTRRERPAGSTNGGARFSEHGSRIRYPAVIATRHNVGACIRGGLEIGGERPLGIEEGARDDTLMRWAGSCFGRGMDFDDTLAECLACNETFSPPMSERQVHKIVNSIARKHSAQRAQRCADHEYLTTWYYRGR